MSEPELVVLLRGMLAAYNSEDWDAFRAGLADDVVVGDHRPPPAVYDGIIGADEFVAAVRSLFELAAGLSVRAVQTHVLNPRAGVFLLSTTGRTDEGSDFELFFNFAYLVNGGSITRIEFFPDDQLPAAKAQLLSMVESGQGGT